MPSGGQISFTRSNSITRVQIIHITEPLCRCSHILVAILFKAVSQTPFSSSNGIALYDQTPFSVGDEEGISDLRFDELQEPDNQGGRSSVELNDYLDLSNSGRAEEDESRL